MIMTPELTYFIKVNLALVLLYAFYRLFFYKDTYFTLRRLVLLSFFVLAFTYPLFNIHEWMRVQQQPLAEVIYSYSVMLPEVVVGETASTSIVWTQLIGKVLLFIYFAVAGGLLVRFFIQLASILRIKSQSRKSVINGIPVCLLSKPAAPFSFFHFIFLYPDNHSEKELEEILAHECTHVAQWHSIDVISSELISIICWANPFVWLLKREVRHNLEYLADNTVIHAGYDSRTYQFHLLGLTHHRSTTTLYNNFNVLDLKNRIIMMNKKRSSKMGRAKYLVFLPLAALLLQFCNIDSAKKESLTDNIAEEKPVAEAIISESTTKHEGQVFTVVEEMPKFPGGEQELLKFINDNIKYPKIAQENGIQGRVIASFVVNKDGSVTDYEVVRGVDPVLDAEALRVISIFPEWTPGKQRGETVRVKYTVPITFRLGGGNDGSSEEIVVQAAETKPTQGKHGLIYTVVEEMPRFPGGDQKLLKFINEGIIYPKEAQEKGIQGRVICSFIVLKDGSVADVETVRGIDPLLDAEAVRVITKMPKWLPGKQGGNAVNVKYTVPITFRLQ